MFDKIVKVMALVGAVCMIALLVGAASIKILNDDVVEVTGNLRVQGVDYASVPVGTIVAFWGTSAPDGWLLCDGRAIPDGSKLKTDPFNMLSTPDLRGMFLRGINTTSNGTRADGWQDVDNRNIGDKQMDAFQNHVHDGNILNDGPDWQFATASSSWYAKRGPTGGAVSGVYGTPRVSTETRPKNVAVNYIIKF